MRFETQLATLRTKRAAITVALGTCLGGLFLLLALQAATDLSRDVLWQVVHNVCVPGQSRFGDPKPCLQVNLAEGVDSGYAVLKDPRLSLQFVLIPTQRISGIESPLILQPNATNYFDKAWEARSFIDSALHRSPPVRGIGLAINSVPSRSQDQFHIHLACARTDVLKALHNNEAELGDHWARFSVPFFGHHYFAMWVPGESLESTNPFELLASGLPGAAGDMANRTLVVVGFNRKDGSKGFVILTDRVDANRHDLAGGEELLDHYCRVASQQTQF